MFFMPCDSTHSNPVGRWWIAKRPDGALPTAKRGPMEHYQRQSGLLAKLAPGWCSPGCLRRCAPNGAQPFAQAACLVHLILREFLENAILEAFEIFVLQLVEYENEYPPVLVFGQRSHPMRISRRRANRISARLHNNDIAMGIQALRICDFSIGVVVQRRVATKQRHRVEDPKILLQPK